MRFLIVLLLSVASLTSCQKEEEGWSEFNSDKWKSSSINNFNGKNYRKKMVFNLVHSQLKFDVLGNNGTNINKIRDLLGKPSKIDTISNSYLFEVEEKFEYNIDPNGGMNLQLFFNNDSTLTHWRIDEFWYQP